MKQLQFKFSNALFPLLCSVLLSMAYAANPIESQANSPPGYGLIALQKGEVTYNSKGQRYSIKFDDDPYPLHFPREKFEDFLAKAEQLAVNDSEWEGAKTLLQNHNHLLNITSPDLKVSLSKGLDIMSVALRQVRSMEWKNTCDDSLVDMGTEPVSSLEQSSYRPKYEFKLTSSGEDKIRRILQGELKSNVQKMVLGLDQIQRVSVEFESGNDNPLLGLPAASGFSKAEDLFEGDDRGKTMNQNLNLGLYYDHGEIHLSQSYTGYGQILSDTTSESLTSSKTPQKFLSVDGLELTFKQDRQTQNGVDYFTRVGLKQEKFTDDGIAKSIQERWHAMSPDVIQYDYIDHFETDRRYSTKLEIGKDFIIKENDNYKIDLSLAPGIQVSNRDSAREISFKGELRLKLKDGEFSEGRDKWEASLYIDARQSRDREKSLYAGAEISRRFQLRDPKNSVYISLGLSYEDDPVVRAYSDEEIERKGSLDLYHNFSVGYERNF